jgi:electron transfer flavoprotein alpha subunit
MCSLRILRGSKSLPLAQRLSAEICATRSVVDVGGAPYEAQVGLTGRTVSPRVYIAVGVSGAVQHTSAIACAGTVIAVNSDRHARIFDFADYGIVADIEKILGE